MELLLRTGYLAKSTCKEHLTNPITVTTCSGYYQCWIPTGRKESEVGFLIQKTRNIYLHSAFEQSAVF